MAVITRADSELGPHRAGVMATPVPDLFGHHSVTPFWIGTQAARNLQQIARARGFLDVSYSWLGDRAGNEIEGRGWGRAGAHTLGFNTRSHALCFVGNLESTPMPDGMIRAAVRICRRGARYGPGRITRPHSAVSSTACPGRHARAQIPAINTAATGSPSLQEDDMDGFTEADRKLLTEVVTALRASTNKPGSGFNVNAYIRKIRGDTSAIRNSLPTLAQINLVTIAAARLVRDEDPDEPVDVEQLAAAVGEAARQAVTEALPAALADLDAETVAAAVVDALPPELAQQVVARIGVKLSEAET